VPLRINGDDIAFRCTPSEHKRWAKVVEKAGLVLSQGKTLVHKRFFSLNSTFFDAKLRKKPSLVPVIRAKSIFGPVDSGVSLGSRMHKACQGFWRSAKREIRTLVLQVHRKKAMNSGCSINRGLGVHLGIEALNRVGLGDHEIYYLSQPEQVDVPSRTLKESDNLKGWKTVVRRPWALKYKSEWQEACRAQAWTSSVGSGAVKIEHRGIGYRVPLSRKTLGSGGNALFPINNRGLARLRRKQVPRQVWAWLSGRKRKVRSPGTAWVPDDAEVEVPVPLFRSCGCLLS